MELKISEIYKLFNKNYKGNDKRVNGISVDTRTLKKNEVFFAIKGEKRDGHEFIQDALKKGASLVICERCKNNMNEKILKVKNTKEALLILAKYYINKFKKIKIIAITGSNGKTTTKELIAFILSKKYKVLKSDKSYNNYLGFSLTAFNLKRNYDFLVAEIGMNHTGEIKKIVNGIKIDTAIITNIGEAHIGFFNSKKEVAMAKSEIFIGLKKSGNVILNKDDEFFNFLKNRANRFKIFTFGKGEGSDLYFKDAEIKKNYTKFKFCYKKEKYSLYTKLMGEHNLYNIAAAGYVGLIYGIKLTEIIEAIKRFKIKNSMRFEIKKIKGIEIINDAYNANINSFEAAIDTLKKIKLENLYIVAGDMYELGKKAKKLHFELGKMLAQLKINGIFWLGKYGLYVKEGYLNGNGVLGRNDIIIKKNKNSLLKVIKNKIKKGDTIFLKGSRLNKLEDIEKILSKKGA